MNEVPYTFWNIHVKMLYENKCGHNEVLA